MIKTKHSVKNDRCFCIISEESVKITKVIKLTNDIINTLVGSIIKNHLIRKPIGFIEYEYITEKQYRDILKELMNKGVYDFSANGLPNAVIDSTKLEDEIENMAKTISKNFSFPSFEIIDMNKLNNDEFVELYNDYLYMNDVLKSLFRYGNKITKKQMKKMNDIYKDVKKCKN